jgi:hypothetical protein
MHHVLKQEKKVLEQENVMLHIKKEKDEDNHISIVTINTPTFF